MDKRLNCIHIISFFCFIYVFPVVSSTDAPVIGILAQEFRNLELYFPNHTSYIAASYVKQVETSGARVVPILIGQNPEYYAKILSHINGVVLPGGGAPFDQPNGYADAGRHIVRILEKMNDEGEVVPILAVCLGFELILEIGNNNKPFRSRCKVSHKNCNLQFLRGYQKSSLFSNFPSKDIKKLATSNITHNNHIWCIEMRDMINLKLTEKWNILTLSEYDSWKFVSSVEHKIYPFAGVQFHPEKNAFEWSGNNYYVHSSDAVKTARLFYDWLIDVSLLNNHAFPSRDALYKNLIHNYDLRPVYPHKIGFEQMYLF